MVKTSSGNVIEVLLGDPAVPVRGEARTSFRLAESLGVCVLINDVFVARGLEDGGCDPWLQHEPAAEVDTLDLLGAIGELGCTPDRSAAGGSAI